MSRAFIDPYHRERLRQVLAKLAPKSITAEDYYARHATRDRLTWRDIVVAIILLVLAGAVAKWMGWS